MKNLIYFGLGGLVVYLLIKNKSKIKQMASSPKQRIIDAGIEMEQAIQNSKFSIPDLSDRKQYQQEQKQCK
jgi:hypothetical protein